MAAAAFSSPDAWLSAQGSTMAAANMATRTYTAQPAQLQRSSLPAQAVSRSVQEEADGSSTSRMSNTLPLLAGVASALAAGQLPKVGRKRQQRLRRALQQPDAEAPSTKDDAAALHRRNLLMLGSAATVVPFLPATAKDEPPTEFDKVCDGVYTFTQAFGIPGLGVGANIPVRCTVMSLEGGGYLVYNPCQPTAEAIKYLTDAGLTDIRYIVCGTIAPEHKYYAPQWASRFPEAEIWVSPRTFSWPIDFGPYQPLGGFRKGSQTVNFIPKDPDATPWAKLGVDHLQLTVDYAPRTVFEETVVYHKPSKSFICTDMLIGLTQEPPEILMRSPYREGLLWFSRNDALQSVDVNSATTIREGYQKQTLLLNNINPRSLLSVAAGDLTVPDQLGKAFQAPQKELGYFGWYPCIWQDADCEGYDLTQRQKAEKSFTCRPGWRGEWKRLSAGVAGTGMQVPSFVAELQISRDPEAVRSFAGEIAKRWPDLQRVVSSHFAAPLPTTAEKVRDAISSAADGPPKDPARRADLSAILDFKEYLEANDLIYKPESGRGQWKWVAA
eukprot:TRINITY_DN8087_c0_g1_i1.p1 TRINITY_DN8087_c0_g1~~TRINITY_DN8087_c0_g1_i1.p1  ORF type:complete len:555 (+),score=111.26 TRINITY_DN8087_c0_g1_i1:150-1814(+)